MVQQKQFNLPPTYWQFTKCLGLKKTWKMKKLKLIFEGSLSFYFKKNIGWNYCVNEERKHGS